jgi:hypothetical protein
MGQPLVDTIVNYVLNVLSSTTTNFANPNPFVITALGTNKTAPKHLPKPVAGKMTDLVMAQFGVLMPAALANISALLPLRSNFLGVELRVTAQAAPTSIYDLVLQLGAACFSFYSIDSKLSLAQGPGSSTSSSPATGRPTSMGAAFATPSARSPSSWALAPSSTSPWPSPSRPLPPLHSGPDQPLSPLR